MIDASTKEALERSYRDLADAVSVGLGNATAAQFQTMATELRSLGLEAPAEGADRLAECVGTQADPVDGLNAFARLEQMLDAVRVRLAPEGRARLERQLRELPRPLFTADDGLGWVLLSRQLPGGSVAVAVFLVDRYCLSICSGDFFATSSISTPPSADAMSVAVFRVRSTVTPR